MKILITTALVAALGAVASAQSLPRLYSPGSKVETQGISLFGWGSGTIAETEEVAFEGTLSVRISSRNYFQGGIMKFEKAPDLSSVYADKANLIQFAIRTLGQSEVTNPGAGSTGAPGAAGSASMGPGDGGGEDGREGGNRTGVPGGGSTATTATEELGELKNIRVIVTTTDGKKSEVILPISTSRPNERGWRTVGVPLQAIRGLDKTNKVIESLALSGEVISSFYVGEIRIINDSTPIYGEPSFREMNVGSGTTVTFSANGFGGSSVLKYTWDFDSANGIDVDAEGQAVKRRFRKPGNYTVTLTISDVFGLKAPHVSTIKITVN